MKIKKLSIGLLLLSIIGLQDVIGQNEFIISVSDKLNRIKSVSYISTKVASAPGDTLEFTEPWDVLHRIFVNPLDSLVGSSSATFLIDDTTKMTDFYNGTVRGKVNWEEQYVKIDSFRNHPYPFRLVYYPFYTKINEILKYSLTTRDSIEATLNDLGDTVHYRLRIFNKHIYFHIKPIVIRNDFIPEDEISQFDIWFDKSDTLPYRMRSKWHHSTSWESTRNPNFNFERDASLIASEYFPAHFEARSVDPYAPQDTTSEDDLISKKAPDWTLKDINSSEISLHDLKSKVLLIQFTGVGCGPCHLSLPFLKQLVEEYRNQDFEFISIETWSRNIAGLIRYQEKNGFNFKFLKSEDYVTQNYDVTSVPIFFVLDEDRIIREIVRGYSTGITDAIIKSSIDKHL